MAKQGMKRPSRTHVKPRNEVSPVPEIQGKAKNSGKKAGPMYGSDLAQDNLTNDLPDADLQDL